MHGFLLDKLIHGYTNKFEMVVDCFLCITTESKSKLKPSQNQLRKPDMALFYPLLRLKQRQSRCEAMQLRISNGEVNLKIGNNSGFNWLPDFCSWDLNLGLREFKLTQFPHRQPSICWTIWWEQASEAWISTRFPLKYSKVKRCCRQRQIICVYIHIYICIWRDL